MRPLLATILILGAACGSDPSASPMDGGSSSLDAGANGAGSADSSIPMLPDAAGLGASLDAGTPADAAVGLDATSAAVTQVACGTSHSCLLTPAGGVKCWGENAYGQLGNPALADATSPTDVTDLASGVVAIAAGSDRSCALTAAGGVKCWGRNNSGALGDGTTTHSWKPVEVSGLSTGVSAISVGGTHACALSTDGGIKCWGSNSYGQLGDGTRTERHQPVSVSGLGAPAISISAGDFHTCAILNSGDAWCWGWNSAGALGDGTTTHSSSPVKVQGLGAAPKSISAGTDHTCAVTAAGAVECWGNNTSGELGDGTLLSDLAPAVPLASGQAVVSAGFDRTCAASAMGGLKCWGSNTAGALGDGSGQHSKVPVDVAGIASGATAVDVGAYHACAVVDSRLKCWGRNSHGQVGDGTLADRPVPVSVLGF